MEFIADFAEVPVERLQCKTKLLQVTDWSKVHPDEGVGIMFDELCIKFDIDVPGWNFELWRTENDRPWWLYPIDRIHFARKDKPFVVDTVTIGDIIRAAEAGVEFAPLVVR